MPLYRANNSLFDLVTPAVGTWIPSIAGNLGSNTLTETFTAYPLWIPHKVTLDRIGCEVVTTAGTAGSLIRMGIYDDASTTYSHAPQNLVLDAGTVSGETTGIKSIVVALTLDRGLYWIGAVSQGSPATHPICYSNASYMVVPGLIQRENQAHVTSLSLIGWVRTSTTASGALPATWGAYNGASDGVRVIVRVA